MIVDVICITRKYLNYPFYTHCKCCHFMLCKSTYCYVKIKIIYMGVGIYEIIILYTNVSIDL